MSLLYRMGTGNGSGGDLKPYIVQFTCDSGYIGQTLTMTYKGTPHAGETVDNVSGTVVLDSTDGKGKLTLYPMHSGEWECSCYSSVIGTTMKKTIDLSYWGPTNVSFEDTPNGATVTPTDDVQTWLHCADVWDKSYTTISEVVADTTTLNTLIANENANDYLVRSTTFATDICNNESAMTYIGLNDYCANKLLADSTWSEAICNSAYFEKVLNALVLPMTSNTEPSGVVSASSELNSADLAYKAFDRYVNTEWKARTWLNEYISYQFTSPKRIKKVRIICGLRIKNFKIQGSTNGSDWTDLYTGLNEQSATEVNVNISDTTLYLHCRLFITDTYGNNENYVAGANEIQFYGREEA